MSQASVPIHSPAPAADGPIACTLHPNEYAGRLEDFRQGVFTHLVGMERPEPSRLRLILAGDTGPGAVQELIREQGCCAFMSFTITRIDVHLVADLEVPRGRPNPGRPSQPGRGGRPGSGAMTGSCW